jgi:hypothetical protein
MADVDAFKAELAIIVGAYPPDHPARPEFDAMLKRAARYTAGLRSEAKRVDAVMSELRDAVACYKIEVMTDAPKVSE